MNPQNKKKQWGILVVGPTPENPDSKRPMTPENDYFWKQCGKFLSVHDQLFYSRQEAERRVKVLNSECWIYAAQKYNPRIHETE